MIRDALRRVRHAFRGLDDWAGAVVDDEEEVWWRTCTGHPYNCQCLACQYLNRVPR